MKYYNEALKHHAGVFKQMTSWAQHIIGCWEIFVHPDCSYGWDGNYPSVIKALTEILEILILPYHLIK